MKDKLITYRLYLQTLEHIQSGDEVVGDRELLEMLKKQLEQDKILEEYYTFEKPKEKKYD